MAKTVLYNRIFAYGERRISVDSNSVQFDPMRAEVPDDDFESTTDKILPGAHNADMMIKGGTSEELEMILLPKLAGSESIITPFTLCMDPGGPFGGRAAFVRGRLSQFKWSGDFGARKDYEMTMYPDSVFAWGFVFFQGVGTAGISAPTVGAGLNLGALGAGQEFVATYHVLDPPGVIGTNPTLDGRIESGTSNAFTVPTNRLALPQATEPTSAYLRIDGDTAPVTDTWWRPNFTAVGGTDSPNFTVLMAAAIRAK